MLNKRQILKSCQGFWGNVVGGGFYDNKVHSHYQTFCLL
jgi:hypothetical protein